MDSPFAFLLRAPRLASLSVAAAAGGVGLGLTGLAGPSRLRLRCDAPGPGSGAAGGLSSSVREEVRRYQSEARTPLFQDGRLNPRAVRQVSAGSIAGLACGLAFTFFSRSLTLLVGLLMLGVFALESRGIHVVPYGLLKKGIYGIDRRRLVQDNAAFKLCFSTTFLLAAFAEI